MVEFEASLDLTQVRHCNGETPIKIHILGHAATILLLGDGACRQTAGHALTRLLDAVRHGGGALYAATAPL